MLRYSFRGKSRIRNLVIRHAVEEFLDRHEGKLGSSYLNEKD